MQRNVGNENGSPIFDLQGVDNVDNISQCNLKQRY